MITNSIGQTQVFRPNMQWCWGSWSGAFYTPESGIRNPGWIKNRDPDPGWTSRSIFPRAWKQFFGLKILELSDVDPNRDPESFWPWIRDPGSRIRDGKIGIRDSHPRSATLLCRIWTLSVNLLATRASYFVTECFYFIYLSITNYHNYLANLSGHLWRS